MNLDDGYLIPAIVCRKIQALRWYYVYWISEKYESFR